LGYLTGGLKMRFVIVTTIRDHIVIVDLDKNKVWQRQERFIVNQESGFIREVMYESDDAFEIISMFVNHKFDILHQEIKENNRRYL